MPFISKTYNVNLIELATRVMLGHSVRAVSVQPIDMDYICCKVPMFSFARLKNSDPRLGVEMQSTGEVACFGVHHSEAFLKAMIAGGFKLPAKNILVSIGPTSQKQDFLLYAKMLVDMGYQLYATKNTHDILTTIGGIKDVLMAYKPSVRREPNVMTLLRGGKIDLVINVADSMDSQALTDGFTMRRTAVDTGCPLLVDMKSAMATIVALHRKWTRENSGREFWSLRSWQEYVEPTV